MTTNPKECSENAKRCVALAAAWKSVPGEVIVISPALLTVINIRGRDSSTR